MIKAGDDLPDRGVHNLTRRRMASPTLMRDDAAIFSEPTINE
jgi:hypothetical protein